MMGTRLAPPEMHRPGYGVTRHYRPSTDVCTYHEPVFGIEAHGSFGGSAAPRCKSSIEMPSGERTKAMFPSRGGRLIVTPPSMSFLHAA
jgi:hypothetical protein